MDTTTIILLAITILCFLCGFYFLFNIKLCKEKNSIQEYPKVSIIIPARNEEQNIGKLLLSIQNQNKTVLIHCDESIPKIKPKQQSIDIVGVHCNEPLQFFEPVLEVIVVNDSSTDKTKEIARGYNATVIDSKPLPDGWLGKPWACWQGANSAKGDIFLFLDSDTFLEPDGLKKIIDSYIYYNSIVGVHCNEPLLESNKNGVHFNEPLLESNKNGVVLSVAPFHKVEKLNEEFSAVFNIIMVGSMNAFTPFKSIIPTGLFGQSLIVSRKNYFEIGGHSSVKNKILENVFMARKFKDAGVNLTCLGGKGTLSFKMYPDGFKSLINGWTKAFAAGAGQTPFFTLLLIILWLSAGFIIIIKLILELLRAIHELPLHLDFLTGKSIIIWLSLYLAYVLQMYWMLRRIGTFKFISSLLFPANLLFYVIVFFRSLYYQITKKSISWKSREVSN